jgi:predicted Zn-ribbon and HTH transcriptional regulator
MPDYSCRSCAWTDERDATDPVPQYCPECGGEVKTTIACGDLEDVETKTDKL